MQFVGGSGPVVTIDRAPATTLPNLQLLAPQVMAYTADSGATTADTLKTALSNTGRGRLLLLGAYSIDATSRTIRLKVTLDGAVVIDATSAAIASGNSGVLVLGQMVAPTYAVGHPIDYQSSLLIEFASSVASETDKIKLFWINEEWA
jgi:hypothetical protein